MVNPVKRSGQPMELAGMEHMACVAFQQQHAGRSHTRPLMSSGKTCSAGVEGPCGKSCEGIWAAYETCRHGAYGL